MNSKLGKKVIYLGLLLLAFAIVGLMGLANYHATIGVGSDSSMVTQVQKKLKQWQFYDGSVDGKYGQGTIDAVKKFQKKHGISQSGTVDEKTAEKMGIQLSGSGGNKTESNNSQGGGGNSSDVYLLARCIYGEGRGEQYKGKVAIGAVILNRVKSSRFPNTIAGVIYQPNAFSVVNDGQINLTPDEECLRAARDAMNGIDPSNGCLFYYNPDKTSNKYMRSLKQVMRIGNHIFCNPND